MLNYVWNKREVEYQRFNDFTRNIDEEIVNIVSTLDWAIESIETDNDSRLVCPYDSSHRIAENTLSRHLETCQWKKEGYHAFDVPLSEPCSSFDEPTSLNVDSELQNRILQETRKMDPTMKVENYESRTRHKHSLYLLLKCIALSTHKFLTLIIGTGERLIPRTSNRIFSDFTCDERRALYEYVISNTLKTDIGHDITDTHKPKGHDKEDKKLSFLELLVQERNLKRRRAKHRGVHTNKKSHIEILREVINQQMELYSDYIRETNTPTRGSKITDVAEIRSSNKNFDDVLSFNESLAKRRNILRDDSDDRRSTSSSRHSDSKHERFEKRHAASSKARDKLEKHSRNTEDSWKTPKRKRRRSHSRERDYEKSKHRSTRENCRRDEVYPRDHGNSDGNRYSKRSEDRRRDRDKLITRMS